MDREIVLNAKKFSADIIANHFKINILKHSDDDVDKCISSVYHDAHLIQYI
jgi:hypothetical protein